MKQRGPSLHDEQSSEPPIHTQATARPWHVGYTERCIIREIPGMSDSDDGYTVAVLTAHSLLPDSEAKANAALIVKAVNNFEALVAALEESRVQIEYLDDKFTRTGTSAATLTRIRAALAGAK